jgi:hypothetical protein
VDAEAHLALRHAEARADPQLALRAVGEERLVGLARVRLDEEDVLVAAALLGLSTSTQSGSRLPVR